VKRKKLVRDNDGWETVSSEKHFANDHLEVATEKVRTPAKKKERSWVVVRRKAAVIVAPMTADGKLLMIKQERVPIRSAIWEMPAGQLDDGESDEDAIKQIALKELREETGYELAPGGELIPLGHYFSSPGFTDEYGYLFFAKPVQPCPSGDEHEETESILDCNAFSVSEIREMIKKNEIGDANTLGICARLAAFGCISLDVR
jgi:ADP-ribose pyrophosphatase